MKDHSDAIEVEYTVLTDEQFRDVVNARKGDAEKILSDQDELDRMLRMLEQKLKVIPGVGEKLAMVPVFIMLIKQYVKKEYTTIPLGTILAIVGAMLYMVSSVDLIPDFIPLLGFADDVAVMAACWKLVESDVRDYMAWRKKNGLDGIVEL